MDAGGHFRGAVANLYYNQPLLNRMGEDLHVSEFTANLIPMVTQIGYALGLLFIIRWVTSTSGGTSL